MEDKRKSKNFNGDQKRKMSNTPPQKKMAGC